MQFAMLAVGAFGGLIIGLVAGVMAAEAILNNPDLHAEMLKINAHLKALNTKLVQVRKDCYPEDGKNRLSVATWYPIPEGPTEVTLHLSGHDWSLIEQTHEWNQLQELVEYLKKEGRLPPNTDP